MEEVKTETHLGTAWTQLLLSLETTARSLVEAGVQGVEAVDQS